MTDNQIELALQTKKLQLSFWDKLSHFAIVGFLMFIPIVSVFLHLKGIYNDNSKPIKWTGLLALTIPTLLGLFFYKLQSDRLKFKDVQTNLSRQELKDIILSVSKELKWNAEEITDNYIIAKTHPSFFSGSWGEQITILFDQNRVLINSICDPDKKISVVSMGRNKANLNKLINEINKAIR